MALHAVPSPAAAGGSILFPATQIPNANPNALDDYEEGTWTPTVTAQTGTITTLGVVTGAYTKVGRKVTCNINIQITTNGTGAGWLIVSLPFASSSAQQGFVGHGWQGSGFQVAGFSGAGGSTVNIYKYDGTYPGASGQFVGLSIEYYV